MSDKPWKGRGHLPLYGFLTAFAVVLAAVVVLFATYQTCAFAGCPDIQQFQDYVPDASSLVVDRQGDEIGKLYRVNRVVIDLDELPTYVPQAFIATEDQEFYDHGGVDWSRALGALWQNLRSGEIEQGFSTISMQVARNVFPDQLPAGERTLNRKIGEIKVARQLESRYTKDQILELYLNQIYFGSGAWGIEAAAHEYFGKPASDLDLGEAALLAGLPQAPSDLNPRVNMEGALRRRETVLRRMRDERFITVEQAEQVRQSPPTLSKSRVNSSDRAAYFMEHVRKVAHDRLGDAIYTGGYTIHTTLDLDIQSITERELERQLEAIETGRYGYYGRTSFSGMEGTEAGSQYSPYLQGAAVVMDAGSGDVLAMVGGRHFDDSQYNRATQARRQPGSAFKPFVYATALQMGLPPTTVLQDTPYTTVRDGRRWSPSNYGGAYAGEITMRDALVKSKNAATIRLAERVGIDRVVRTARDLGLPDDVPHYLSLAIGAAEVSLLDLTTAYAAFATLGDLPTPRFIARVTDREDNLLWRVSTNTRRALDRDIAFLTVDFMRDAVDRGTGTAVRSVGFREPAAGKTGTTNESADAWFLGFTPRTVAGVWIGMDQPEQIMPQATGGRLAAPVWGRIMRQIGRPGGDWSPPAGIEQYRVDARGAVLASNCPVAGEPRQEYFIRGTVRTTDCFGNGYAGDSLYRRSNRGDEDGRWRRPPSRLFGEDDSDRERRDSARSRLDAAPLVPARHDTIILETDSTPVEPDTDTLLGEAIVDTTLLLPPPPDTSPRPRPGDSLRLQVQPPRTPLRDTTRDTVPPDILPVSVQDTS